MIRSTLHISTDLTTSARTLLFAIFSLAALAAQAGPPPIEDFFRDYQYEAMLISPSGRRLAAIFERDGIDNLAVVDLASRRGTPISGLERAKLEWVAWAGEDWLIYGLHRREFRGYSFHIAAVRIDGGINHIIGGARGGRGCNPLRYVHESLLSLLPHDPRHILISSDCASYRGVYHVDIETGERREISAAADLRADDFVADHRGTVRVAISTDEDLSTRVHYRSGEQSTWAKLSRYAFGDVFRPLGFAADDSTLYVASNLGRDHTALFAYDPENRRFGELLFEHPDVDVGGTIFTRDQKHLIGVTYHTERGSIHYFDVAAAEIHTALAEAFPDSIVSLLNHTDDESRYVVEVSSDRHPGIFYLFDRETQTASELANRAAWINPAQMPSTEAVQFAARDGTLIHGYLTIPPGVKPARLPLVIHPHGGPYGIREIYGFDPEVKFLGSRGYAVLQVNFRGSGGYGRTFLEAGYGEWGGLMQDDLTDATRWAIAEGIADEQRICIFGASYGGYAALMGLIKTPELYRCGITYAGVSDLNLLVRVSGLGTQREAFLDRVLGKRTDAKALREASPTHLARRIQAPVLIAHSRNDHIVDYLHAKELRKALKRLGKTYEWLINDEPAHGFIEFKHRVELYERIAAFLGRHIGAGAESTEPIAAESEPLGAQAVATDRAE